MFKFFKEKLGNVVKKFSKDVEEEAEVVEAPVEKEVEKKEVPKPKEMKKVPKKEVEKESPKEKVEEPAKEEEKSEPEKEVDKPAKKEPPKEEKKELPKKVEEKKEIKGVKITYFVHGTTTDNENELATGWEQGELSDIGVKQSKELPDKIDDKNFSVVFCSDLKRAVDSAELSFKGKFKIIKDKRLREADYGEYTLLPVTKFKPRMTEFIDEPFPKGESYRKVEKRMAEFVNYLYKNHYGEHIAIVAHQGPQLALDVLLKGKNWEQAIKEDWRLQKKWQPGWEYFVSEEVEVPEVKEKKGFFSKIFHKKEEVEEKPVEEEIKKEPPKVEEEPEKKTILKKVGETFTKVQLSQEKFDELFWDLELMLLENNMAVEVIEKIKKDLKEELTTGKVSRKNIQEMIKDSLKKSIEEVLDVEKVDLFDKIKAKKPYVIAVIGVNGSGKTTAIAKLTKMFQDKNLSVVLAAADTFRAAAIQQLEEHANKLGVKMIKHDYNSDPAAVAFDAVKHAEAKKIDVVLIDTAGRLHSNDNLMQELQKLIRVNKPDFKLFVGESITGNDCVEQAKKYDEMIGIDGILLTKADIDEKGGAPISISYVTKKPVLFIGTGQTYSDIKEFDKEEILKNIGL